MDADIASKILNEVLTRTMPHIKIEDYNEFCEELSKELLQISEDTSPTLDKYAAQFKDYLLSLNCSILDIFNS